LMIMNAIYGIKPHQGVIAEDNLGHIGGKPPTQKFAELFTHQHRHFTVEDCKAYIAQYGLRQQMQQLLSYLVKNYPYIEPMDHQAHSERFYAWALRDCLRYVDDDTQKKVKQGINNATNNEELRSDTVISDESDMRGIVNELKKYTYTFDSRDLLERLESHFDYNDAELEIR